MKLLSTLFAFTCAVTFVEASSLKVSVNSTTRSASEVEGIYGTAHVYIDEVAGESVPFTIFFDPQTTGVQAVEVYTNLNRRDRADDDADGDGIHDGIKPVPGSLVTAGSDAHYYRAYPMQLVSGGYQLTLNANKTGAYRLNVRWRLNSDPASVWRYYTSDPSPTGQFGDLNFRAYAIVVTAKKSRDVIMYEVNPLTITATGTLPSQRGTFAEMATGVPGVALGKPRFNLDYVKGLGANMLWFQPIHPNGIDGRQIDPVTSQPFEVGSPYAVRNFFDIMPLMARAFTPGGTPATNDTPTGRAQALAEFQSFSSAADAAGVDIMLDAPFNHTSYDVELGALGQTFWGNGGSNAASQIRNVEARFFARHNAYDMRASSAGNIAVAPDRYDFGKFADTFEVFFGRYASLVPNSANQGRYLNEDDWFDYSIGNENTQGDGHFDTITHRVWQYFHGYIDHWLTQTGYPTNAAGASLNSTVGVDGLRADFGQGLPPPAWEYIINRTKTRKWNFLFMAESLDGGAVTYRSGRHFDILNENIVFPLHAATTTAAFRSIFEVRRSAYGQAGILLNTSSHDEDHYNDPWEALIRYAVLSTNDGVPMIFPGQELGLSGTVIPPADSNNTITPFGYDRYEINFGKPIPHFKKYNSLVPLWLQTDPTNPSMNYGIAQMYPVYAAVGQARAFSRALRSPNRYFLDRTGGLGTDSRIFSVAKYEIPNASPATSDVVFGFVNLQRNNDPVATFDVNITQNGSNLFGIKPARRYNVRNIAAYTGVNPNRRDNLLWSAGKLGSELLANGVYVELKRIPTTNAAWATAPYEAQYLKLYDTTAPVATPSQPQGPNAFAYEIGNSVLFSWPTVAPDAEGVVPSYRVQVSVNGGPSTVFFTSTPSYTVNAAIGQTVSVIVQAVNPNDTTQAGPASASSASIQLLSATGDADGDGQNNGAEKVAGTNPLDHASSFRITHTSRPAANQALIEWSSVAGKNYEVWATNDLTVPFTKISGPMPVPAAGATTSFTDPTAPNTQRFYQVRIAP